MTLKEQILQEIDQLSEAELEKILIKSRQLKAFVKEFLVWLEKQLSFSKKVENCLGAILYFIHDYNSKLSVSL